MTHPLAVHRRFFDAAHCPECGAGIDGPRARCATCGLLLTGPTATRLAGQLSTADRTMDQLRAESQASVPACPPPRYAVPPVARRSTSISGSAVILGLGGLCLMVAAVVFISVSWGTLTLTDKAAVLGVVTAVLALCSAAVTRKGLRGSAETLWACTLIDLALDLWAVRRTGLAGSGRLTPDAYCSLAATAIALVALTCCLLTRRSTLTRPSRVRPGRAVPRRGSCRVQRTVRHSARPGREPDRVHSDVHRLRPGRTSGSPVGVPKPVGWSPPPPAGWLWPQSG